MTTGTTSACSYAIPFTMKQIGSPQSEVGTSLSTYHYISIVKVGDSVFFKAAKKRSANVKGKKVQMSSVIAATKTTKNKCEAKKKSANVKCCVRCAVQKLVFTFYYAYLGRMHVESTPGILPTFLRIQHHFD